MDGFWQEVWCVKLYRIKYSLRNALKNWVCKYFMLEMRAFVLGCLSLCGDYEAAVEIGTSFGLPGSQIKVHRQSHHYSWKPKAKTDSGFGLVCLHSHPTVLWWRTEELCSLKKWLCLILCEVTTFGLPVRGTFSKETLEFLFVSESKGLLEYTMKFVNLKTV